MQTEKFSLKDHLFSPKKVEKIAKEIALVHPDFLVAQFVAKVLAAFPNLELKERINHIAVCLRMYLPENYEEAVNVLVNSLPAPCNPLLSDQDFGDFIYAPYGHYVAKYGCHAVYLEKSLQVLEQITMRFSAEDAIRYFINSFPEQTMLKMLAWASHKHYHVRRLASEGSRPKLPWCIKINVPIHAALPILNILHADTSRFVTRSVANHLNDISKKHPRLVIDTLISWKKDQRQNQLELNFIIKHALRTLLKNGDAAALSLVGFDLNRPVQISEFKLTKELEMDSYLNISFELHAIENAKLMIDYVLYFRAKNDTLNRKKVFKLKEVSVKKGEKIVLHKSQQLKEKMSTRILYPGEQGFALQVNGQILYEQKFILRKKGGYY